MGRAVMLSNGEMLVGLNERGMVHDFYYPYIGQENLTNARSVHHMIGVWVDGTFSWLDDNEWDISTNFEASALISNISAEHTGLGVRLQFTDFIDSEINALCRRINVTNSHERPREIRVFLHQVFQISADGRADTVLYVPEDHYILDYKGHCSLLIYAHDTHYEPFDQFAVGNYGIENKAGTFKDAEDGELSGNLVEHAGVDSVIRCKVSLASQESTTLSYWVIADHSQYDAEQKHKLLLHEGLAAREKATRKYWHDWLKPAEATVKKVPEEYRDLFLKSLLVVKSHIDKRGGIIASCDSSIYNYGRDYYSYVWPRDGALTMLPLIELGFYDEVKNFFLFCADTVHADGYMMHKYQPDRAIGSTWHPLMHKHHPELAIQEDETATVIFAIGKYLAVSHDATFVQELYKKLVRPGANFMSKFIDEETNLPHASYDLWEERFATHTYSVASTLGALEAAVSIAERFGENEDAIRWRKAQLKITDGFRLLYNDDQKSYRKSILLQPDGNIEFNNTIDSSSWFGVYLFLSSPDHVQLKQSIKTTEEKLYNISPSGGAVRYEHDGYFLRKQHHLGNPWIICTLWLAQWYSSQGDKKKALEIVRWTRAHCSQSGMLAEQIDPEDGSPVGVMPLVWSHAEVVATLLLLTN